MSDTYPIPDFLRSQPVQIVTPIERPILFSAPMVRALLAGTKTQTRRVVKPQPDEHGLNRHGDVWPKNWKWFDSSGLDHRCPYGQPGDRLWVREAFSGPRCEEEFAPSAWYQADNIWYWADGNPSAGDWTKPRPSIHMPRWASRILLEIVAVRVERLNSISGSDAANEGVQVPCDESGRPLLRLTGKVQPSKFSGKHAQDWTADDYLRFEYAELWESINGPGSWSANPFVWVVEFRRVL